MIAPQQHSIQDSPPDNLLAKLRKRLNYRWREVTKESAIDPAVALERGYRLETTKRGLERLGFKRSQQRAPALVIPRFSPCGEPIPPQIKPDNPRASAAERRDCFVAGRAREARSTRGPGRATL